MLYRPHMETTYKIGRRTSTAGEGSIMAAGVAHDYNWTNLSLFRVSLVLGIMTYLLGVAMLILIAVPVLLYLVYRWLRDGVWYSYALADILEGASESDNTSEAGITTWCFETPLLAVTSAVGGSLTVSGLAILFGIGFMIMRREEGQQPGPIPSDGPPESRRVPP